MANPMLLWFVGYSNITSIAIVTLCFLAMTIFIGFISMNGDYPGQSNLHIGIEETNMVKMTNPFFLELEQPSKKLTDGLHLRLSSLLPSKIFVLWGAKIHPFHDLILYPGKQLQRMFAYNSLEEYQDLDVLHCDQMQFIDAGDHSIKLQCPDCVNSETLGDMPRKRYPVAVFTFIPENSSINLHSESPPAGDVVTGDNLSETETEHERDNKNYIIGLISVVHLQDEKVNQSSHIISQYVKTSGVPLYSLQPLYLNTDLTEHQQHHHSGGSVHIRNQGQHQTSTTGTSSVNSETSEHVSERNQSNSEGANEQKQSNSEGANERNQSNSEHASERNQSNSEHANERNQSNSEHARERNQSNSEHASERNQSNSEHANERNQSNSEHASERNQSNSEGANEQNQFNSEGANEQNQSNSEDANEQNQSNSEGDIALSEFSGQDKTDKMSCSCGVRLSAERTCLLRKRDTPRSKTEDRLGNVCDQCDKHCPAESHDKCDTKACEERGIAVSEGQVLPKSTCDNVNQDDKGESEFPTSSLAECVVCQTRRVRCALLPCRHACVCLGCFRLLFRCPMCRAGIESYFLLRDHQDEDDDADEDGGSEDEMIQDMQHQAVNASVYQTLHRWNDRLNNFLGFR